MRHKELFGIMDMFHVLIVVIVTQVYKLVKPKCAIRVVYFIVCTLYLNKFDCVKTQCVHSI